MRLVFNIVEDFVATLSIHILQNQNNTIMSIARKGIATTVRPSNINYSLIETTFPGLKSARNSSVG